VIDVEKLGREAVSIIKKNMDYQIVDY